MAESWKSIQSEMATSSLSRWSTNGKPSLASKKAERLLFLSNAIFSRAFANLGELSRANDLTRHRRDSNDPLIDACEAVYRFDALKSTDQLQANKLGKTIKAMISDLDTDASNGLESLIETLTNLENRIYPAAFLARESINRSYPKGGLRDGTINVLQQNIERAINRQNQTEAIKVVQSILSIEDKDEYNHYIYLPQLIAAVAEAFESLKWYKNGSVLKISFDEFSHCVHGYISEPNNLFYGSILHSNLALALLAMDSASNAGYHIEQARKMVVDSDIRGLDFIDSSASLVKTIEGLPLEKRSHVLQTLLVQFKTRFDCLKNPYLNNHRLFFEMNRSLLQIVECAY